MEVDGQLLPAALHPTSSGYHCKGGFDAVVKKMIHCLYRDSNLGSSDQ